MAGWGGTALFASLTAALVLTGCADGTIEPELPLNRPPAASRQIPDQHLVAGHPPRLLDLVAHFSDPEGDSLSYTAESSDTFVIAATTDGAVVSLVPRAPGTATVMVTASDPSRLSATASFMVVVEENRSPRGRNIPLQHLAVGQGIRSLPMAGYFTDPNGDTLSYAAESSDTIVIAARAGGPESIDLEPFSAGLATVTVIATDPGGLSSRRSFGVVVNEDTPGRPFYPIHVYWIDCDGSTANCRDTNPVTGLGLDSVAVGVVMTAVQRWAEVLAPTSQTPLVADNAFCPAEGHYTCRWAPGDTLPPGLHLFVQATEAGSSAYASRTTDGFPRWGAIRLHIDQYYDPRSARAPERLRWLALHEIGHILGIGSGAWWYENVAAVNDNTWVMTDATALALYNRMGGSGWHGPRLLLGGVAGQGGTAHWNHCIAPQDVMASGNYWLDPDGDIQVPYITELTASSLARGYRYDPALIRVADFNGGADGSQIPNHWTADHCTGLQGGAS